MQRTSDNSPFLAAVKSALELIDEFMARDDLPEDARRSLIRAKAEMTEGMMLQLDAWERGE